MTAEVLIPSAPTVRRLLAIAAAGLGLLCAPGAARCDVATLEDAKYQRAFDAAVDKALAYLAKAQLPDGSFPGGMPKNTAIASLCVMAFLARGYSPGLPPYGDTINRGIDFVLAAQDARGLLIGAGRGQMYSHNISTLMLSEISGMVAPERQKRVDEALPKALKAILAAQDVQKQKIYQGGWRYEPNSTDSDLSHSGWALMALRSARNNGATVPKEAIDRAVSFLLSLRNADGGFSYQVASRLGSGVARTGAGLLKREYFFYGLYYCAQGMFQLGGEEWEKFAPRLYDTVLKMQKEDGSWESPHNQEKRAGPCYSTGMAVLALSVSYRQLPIYQR